MQVEDLLKRGVTQDSVAWDVVIMSYEETLHMLGRGWVRVQHPTRPVGLAGWHVRPPLCFKKKECADRVNFYWRHHENLWQCVSIFSYWSTSRFGCVLFFLWDDVLKFLRRAVRIYVSACQNRFQWICGFLPFSLFVCCRWFGIGNKLLLLKG